MTIQKKENVLTDQQQLFLEALRDPDNKGNLKLCMSLAGYASTTPTSYVVKSLTREIIEVANELIAANTAKAAMAIVDVLDKPTLASRQTVSAAKEILDRAGVNKKEGGDLKLTVGDGIIILPAKDPAGQ